MRVASGVHWEPDGYAKLLQEATWYLNHDIKICESNLERLVSVYSSAKTPSHQELIEFCRQVLLQEGFDPIRIKAEFPISIHDRNYVADLVVLDGDDRIQVVVECGQLSDPVKIQLFSSLFKRFIWMPYALIPDLTKVAELKTQVAVALGHYKEGLSLIEHALREVQTKEDEVDVKLQEIRAIRKAIKRYRTVIIDKEYIQGIMNEPDEPVEQEETEPSLESKPEPN